MTDCDGTAGSAGAAGAAGAGELLATRDGGRLEGVASDECWRSLLLPDQLATTRPVASAVATTRAIPMAVSFHGLFQARLVMIAPLLASIGQVVEIIHPQFECQLWRRPYLVCFGENRA